MPPRTYTNRIMSQGPLVWLFLPVGILLDLLWIVVGWRKE